MSNTTVAFEALTAFFRQFLPVFPEDMIPIEAHVPYITAPVMVREEGIYNIRVWYHHTDLEELLDKVDEISKGVSGWTTINFDGGCICLDRGDTGGNGTWMQLMPGESEYVCAYLTFNAYMFVR